MAVCVLTLYEADRRVRGAKSQVWLGYEDESEPEP